jgi:single-strand DNA-binding protein
MSINRVVMVGNLARDPELRYTPAGVAVASTAIAVNRITKNDSGDYDVDFFNITAFQRTADYLSKYLTKGSKVAIEGRLQSRSWVDQASGQKRTAYEIIVDNVQSLSSRQDNEMASGNEGRGGGADMGMGAAPEPTRSAPARSAPASGKAMVPAPDDIEDEADPFADE